MPEVRGTALTLNRRAAARLGVRPLRLDALALRAVLDAGEGVASPALAHRTLTRAVQAELAPREAALTARALSGAVRELLRVQADLGRLEQVGSAAVARLARVTAAYRTALRGQGLLDAVEVVGRAAELITPQVLTVFGYVRLSPGELAFLDAAAAEGSVLALPWAEHAYFEENRRAAEALAARGWTVDPSGGEAPGLAGAFLGQPGAGRGELFVAADEDQEVRAALRRVKGLVRGGVPAGDVALVVPDDDVWAPRVRAVAQEYGLPLRLSTSLPLSRTRPGRWLERVLAAVEDGVSFTSLARVLAHALDAGMDGPLWRQVQAARPGDPAAWAALGMDAGGFDWPEQATRGAWVGRMVALIESRGVADRARRTQDLLAVNFLLAELTVLAEPAGEILPREAFVSDLRDLLSLVTVPSDPGTQGVELLTLPGLVGAQVPHVFLLGAVDGALPARLQDDPALDFMERRHLAAAGHAPVETAASLSRRDAMTFWAVLASAGHLTVSYSRVGPGGEAHPSPFLAPLPLDRVAAPDVACSPEEARRAALWQGGYVDATLPGVQAAHAVEVRRISAPDYDEFDGLTGLALNPDEWTFSASQLAVLGRCTFRWWLEYALRLKPDAPEGEPLGLGRLRHAALAHAALAAAQIPGRDVREVMLGALDEGLRRAESDQGWAQTPEWTHERQDVLGGLRGAVQGAGFLAPDAAPIAAERPFAAPWRGLQVRGVVDRVDRLGERLHLVDYKSGVSAPTGVQDSAGRLNLDVQLALYAEAALPALYPGAPLGGAAYVSLKTGAVTARLKLVPAELDAFTGRVRHALATGAFPPRPDAALSTCRTCPWTGVCRGGERLLAKGRA